jgi:uncharacterized protein YbbK (DUF523 family)
MIICSACLLGIKCRYDGKAKPNKKIIDISTHEKIVPVCPEQLGGLPIPGEPRERSGESVFTKSGKDVTKQFLKGAEETLKIAKDVGAIKFIAKSKSPSCGCGKIYDGSFSGKLINGNGVTTDLLKRNNIEVITEEDL